MAIGTYLDLKSNSRSKSKLLIYNMACSLALNCFTTADWIAQGFSLPANIKSLLSTSHRPGQVLCLNGIRFWSMVWVLVAHMMSGFKGVFLQISNVVDYYLDISSTLAFRFMLNGYVSVDSFFFIGGCLLSLLTLKQLDKTSGKLNLLLYYLHRYLRLISLTNII